MVGRSSITSHRLHLRHKIISTEKALEQHKEEQKK
jgi:hypothetical protein